jgi:uncharacterized protein (DUF2384 family)
MSPFAETLTESTPEDRAQLVVRLATLVFGDGVRAADWLVHPNDAFSGLTPLLVAKQSMVGCARVCQTLDQLIEARPAYIRR